MNSMFVVFAAALAVAYGGVIAHTGVISQTVIAPAIKSTHIQGPGTSTHIVGPDGSQIVAEAPGAVVHTSEQVGIASEVITPVVAPVAYAHSPVLAHTVVTRESPPVVPHKPLIAVPLTPVVHHVPAEVVVDEHPSVVAQVA